MAIVTGTAETVGAGRDTWQSYVKTAIRSVEELCEALNLPRRLAKPSVVQPFSTFVPQPYLDRIRRGDPNDPLLLQVLPQRAEADIAPGFGLDAVGDQAASVAPGIIHKYKGRALIIATGTCAVHCRYCFRRHFPYESVPASTEYWELALKTVRDDTSISEVILSGGDPLMLVDSRLAELIDVIAEIPHVRRLRIHSRLPIVIPQRITGLLVKLLRSARPTIIVVVHANHPNELNLLCRNSLARLMDAGIPVLNQSVLLKNVNDDIAVLVKLSEQLLECRVIPYYLHQLDRVLGAAHFEVPISRGKFLVEQMRQRLPGYAVPRYVRDVAGQSAKEILA